MTWKDGFAIAWMGVPVDEGGEQMPTFAPRDSPCGRVRVFRLVPFALLPIPMDPESEEDAYISLEEMARAISSIHPPASDSRSPDSEEAGTSSASTGQKRYILFPCVMHWWDQFILPLSRSRPKNQDRCPESQQNRLRASVSRLMKKIVETAKKNTGVYSCCLNDCHAHTSLLTSL